MKYVYSQKGRRVNGRMPRPEERWVRISELRLHFFPTAFNFALRFRPHHSTTTWWICASVHSPAFEQYISIHQELTPHFTREKVPDRSPTTDFLQPCLTLNFGRLPSATSAGLRMKSQLTLLLRFWACRALSSWPLFLPSVMPLVMSTPSLFL